MGELKLIDYAYLYCLFSMWFLLGINLILAISGYLYFNKMSKLKESLKKRISKMSKYPKVSILIPAHNEEVVIRETLKAILKMDYPSEKMEIIVINDNSSDSTGKILDEIVIQNPNRLKIITTNKETGGKGKSGALNNGYKVSTGKYLVIYDADNTPEKNALRYLVSEIEEKDSYGAVIGKFRTRNKKRNILTKFINIETLGFQWMAQAGRWNLFNLCTIPGTNFIIKRKILEEIGGWDEKALSEDTEISFRIYGMGYLIGFMPFAVTWEQEPEKVGVWLKQRSRWVKGNVYVILKFLKSFRKGVNFRIMFDIIYFITVYFLFFSAIILSNIIFLLGIFTDSKIIFSGEYTVLWVLAYLIFILELYISLSLEEGEGNYENFFLVSLMYFTYTQLWLIAVIKGCWDYLRSSVKKERVTWYKTERF